LTGERGNIIAAEQKIDRQARNIDILESRNQDDQRELREIEHSRVQEQQQTNQLREQITHLQEFTDSTDGSGTAATNTLLAVQNNLETRTQQLSVVKQALQNSNRDLIAERDAHRVSQLNLTASQDNTLLVKRSASHGTSRIRRR